MNSRAFNVLIVDDNEMNRDMLARRLERKGYVVRLAESARSLLERIQKEAVDLVLLDVEMPEISGLDALETLRGVYSPAELPIIMVTAKDQSEDIVKALNLGANDYLTKPIDFPVALARIRTQVRLKQAEEALRESEERYALAARGANDGLWDWNLLSNAIYFSPRWKMMLGYEEAEIQNRPEEWLDRIHVADRERVKDEISAHQRGLTPHFESENRIQHKDGTFRWMLSRGLAVHDSAGKPWRMAGSQTDITGGKIADALTGLPNRLLFIDRLERLIEHTKRHKNYLFAVVFLDLDGFKMINDSLGHVAGDQLLVGVANRLEKCLRVTDTVTRIEKLFTIARLGGDEFTILLDQIADPNDVTLVAERLMSALALPFDLGGKEVFTSASMGIALSSIGYDKAEDILRDADTAMYRAKSLGKSRCEVFDVEMRARVIARLQLETDLRNAVERKEFRNFYQPIISLDSGSIVGFEALLRWQHPGRGLVQPLEFIPVAEETGIIRELGWWNFQEACRQIGVWNAHRNDSSPLTMSVNLSIKQLLQPNLVADIDKLLREMGLSPEILKLEITESTVMADPSGSVEMLRQIKSLGVQLSVDDFGTGYSSLSYLQRFPLDTLKIDRSFTQAIGEGGDSMEIVRTLLPMAKSLRLNVIAEGVETAEQLAILRKLHCEYAQGFYFSKPVTADEAGALLGKNPRW
ncbi:MAG TPA: EAL domain-containing protein [Candidatus Acidoferrum sp.]|jgi:diguanylate cyclase (GGDEF)-like protein/PAS domain S-box-containing protein